MSSFISLLLHPIYNTRLRIHLGNVGSLDKVADGELDVALNGIPHDCVGSVVDSVDVGAGAVGQILKEESSGYIRLVLMSHMISGLLTEAIGVGRSVVRASVAASVLVGSLAGELSDQ